MRRILQNKVFRNFSYLTIGSIVAQGLSLLTILKITRVFSPSDYGLFTFIMAQGLLLLAIADLGIQNIVIRSIARNKERTNDLLVNGVFLKIIATFVLIILYVGYNKLLGSLGRYELSLLFVFTLLSSLSHLLDTVFLGREKMLPISLINVIYSLSWFSVVFLLPDELFTVSLLFWVFLALNAAKVASQYILLKVGNLLIGSVGRFWQSSQVMLRESWPYFSLVFIMIPVNHFSNNFLDINSTTDEIGYYNLSQKLLGPVSMVLGFALSAIFPNLSALWAKDKAKFYAYISSGFKYFMLPALVLCTLFTLFAREAVVLLFTDAYLPAVRVCQLQVWFVFLMGVNSLIGTILGATNNEKLLLKLGVVNALVSTPLLYLGSFYGAIGLSCGYVLSFALFEIYLWIKFRKALNLRIDLDGQLWLLAVLFFLGSYFIPVSVGLMYRLMLGGLTVVGLGLFFKKSIRPSLAI